MPISPATNSCSPTFSAERLTARVNRPRSASMLHRQLRLRDSLARSWRAGHQVLEVNRGATGAGNPSNRREVRHRGAETAARSVLAGQSTAHPEDRGRGGRVMMRHLKVARRTATLQSPHSDVLSAMIGR